MKILITGVDGFLGQHISDALLKNNHEIHGISNGICLDDRIAFVKVDLTNKKETLGVISRIAPDLCIHLAAMAHADVAKDKEHLVREVNVQGAFNLLDALEHAGCKKIIYFSTVKVLADLTDERGVDESIEPNPVGIYAATKREVEIELKRRSDEGRIVYTVIRPTPVIGAGDTKGNYAKMLQMVQRGFFPLFDGGKARRSIVFADTLADRVCTIVNKGIINGRSYVFSDGTFTIEQIVDAMRIATGYSFCPKIPIDTLKPLIVAIEVVAAQFKKGVAPADLIIKRLCESYVVKTHLFETDYGQRQSIVIPEKFKSIVDSNSCHVATPDKNTALIRNLDILFASTGLAATAPIMAVMVVLGFFDTGSPVFLQERIGINKKPFKLIKFRTMKKNTKSVASHLAAESSITPLGKFLRKTKIDELPQLINVLKGEMSLVGPRPNLFNQEELIDERSELGVYDALPGITGLAQISNIDMSTPALLAKTDAQMLKNLSLKNYLAYILKTAIGNGSGDAVHTTTKNIN